jgi:hypothetical protein
MERTFVPQDGCQQETIVASASSMYKPSLPKTSLCSSMFNKIGLAHGPAVPFSVVLLLFASVLPTLRVIAQDNPVSIDVPPGNVLLLQAQGRGDQVYGCVDKRWVLTAPDARLFDERGDVIGKHYAGPTWQLNDGSLLTAKAIAKKESQDAVSVPWLLLRVISGNGKFANVEYVQRSETHGGAAPTAPCGGEPELRVPYTATYSFYGPRP